MLKKYRVPKYAITEKGLRRLLKREANDHASLADWAEEHGILSQTVSAFNRKVQGAGLQIPEALGYRPQIVFIPLDEELISTPLPSRRPTKRPSKKTDQSREPLEKRHSKPKDDRKATKRRMRERSR